MKTIEQAFADSAPRPSLEAHQSAKKNYGEKLSRNIAWAVADGLRSSFPGILPTSDGSQQESKARTPKGFKKLDVNYSTSQLGLALGVSVKSINFVDKKSGRYTKNYSRNENELRAEATDYHKRQPWAVLVAVVFLPIDSCDDGNMTTKDGGASSFGAAVRFFRNISGRATHNGAVDHFERVFVGLYQPDGAGASPRFFDVDLSPPKSRRPTDEETISFGEILARIRATYDSRNNPPFLWAGEAEPEDQPLEVEDDD